MKILIVDDEEELRDAWVSLEAKAERIKEALRRNQTAVSEHESAAGR